MVQRLKLEWEILKHTIISHIAFMTDDLMIAWENERYVRTLKRLR